MSAMRIHFSLRALLSLSALIAVAIVFVANYPFLTAMFLLIIGPLLLRIGVAPYVSAIAPRYVHWIVAVLQVGYSCACGLCLLRVFPPSLPNGRVYIWLATLTAVPIVSVCLTWAHSNAVSASNRGGDEATGPSDD
jgi:hypothetical protein